MSTTRKTTPRAGRAKVRQYGEAKAVAGDTSARDAVRRKPAPPKPTPGKRGEVNDAHDRYANIEVT